MLSPEFGDGEGSCQYVGLVSYGVIGYCEGRGEGRHPQAY